MKRGVILIFLVLVVPLVMAVTGEVITGEVPQAPTDVSMFVLPGPPVISIVSPENKTYYDTNILLNYSIRNELNNSWYNLDNSENISLGNLTNNSFYFDTSLGTHTLYFYANNTLGESAKNVSFTISQQETPPSSSSSSSGGGGGSSSSGTGAPVSYFELNKYLIEVELIQGETKAETIELVSNANEAQDISIELVDLDEMVLIDEKEFTLGPKEKKEITLNFFSLTTTLSGLYFGKIVFSSNLDRKEAIVVIDLKEKEALFDLNLEVLPQYKIVSPGKKISTLIEMTNIGFRGTAVDVELFLYITDSDKNIFYESSKEVLAVKTDISLTKKLIIPSDIPIGTYFLVGELKYNNISATSYDTIRVAESKVFRDYFSWILLFVILILLIIVIFMIKKLMGKKTKKRKKK